MEKNLAICTKTLNKTFTCADNYDETIRKVRIALNRPKLPVYGTLDIRL